MSIEKKLVQVVVARCERCGYEWVVRAKNVPVACANRSCKRRDWNVPNGGKSIHPIERIADSGQEGD